MILHRAHIHIHVKERQVVRARKREAERGSESARGKARKAMCRCVTQETSQREAHFPSLPSLPPSLPASFPPPCLHLPASKVPAAELDRVETVAKSAEIMRMAPLSRSATNTTPSLATAIPVGALNLSSANACHAHKHARTHAGTHAHRERWWTSAGSTQTHVKLN